MVDAADSKSAAERRGSSTLPGGTSANEAPPPLEKHRPRAARGRRPPIGPSSTAQPASPSESAAQPEVEGVVEGLVGTDCIGGWALDAAAPDLHGFELAAVLGGVWDAAAPRARPEHPRPDLGGRGDGRHGFLLALPKAFSPGDLARGRLRVHPVRDGALLPPLALHADLLAQERVLAGLSLLADAEKALGQARLTHTMAMMGRPQGFGGSRLAGRTNLGFRARIVDGVRIDDMPLSPLHFPVGLLSGDGSAVLGEEGHLFLLEGSNGSIASLGAERTERDRLIDGWLALIAERQARCAAAGIAFLQIVVPEKASLLPALLPDPAQRGPSPLLLALEARIAALPELGPSYLSGLAVLGGNGDPRPMLRCLDTHPAPAGLHGLARAVLARLGRSGALPEPPSFRASLAATGDLVDRFFGAVFAEELAHVPRGQWRRLGGTPRVVEAHEPAKGGHVGRREQCRTDAAPIPARLLMFGNSVCSVSGSGQTGLSGWLARWVRDYHFHWTAELDWAEVERVRPDMVICQTVERFLGTLPDR